MITIGKVNFEFEASNQPFIQSLYGDWDHFFRVAFEEVADSVLGRYDNADELIRIESLTVDMGTFTEEEFRDEFPRILTRKLSDLFAAYLLNKEAHPEEISVISISRSSLEILSYYLIYGYLRSDLESATWNLVDSVEEALRLERDAFCLFLQTHGDREPLRERLAFQLNDEVLEMLTVALLPSDSSFINPYVRFLLISHRSLERPEITTGDYRNAVWTIVLAYLLSESKGYFSRKKFVVYTLQELAGRYNIQFQTLLNLLTIGLKEYVSNLLVIPELLSILSEIREEQFRDERSDVLHKSLSDEELFNWLSTPESCRKLLRPMSESEIYGLVGRVFPSESVFVISYAQALDDEKSRGMLEGKAGEEFRVLKWEYIFQVLCLSRIHAGSFVRHQFAYSVLEKLAAHYNLKVLELITYFYESLIHNKVYVDSFIRELVIALYLEQVCDLTDVSVIDYSMSLTEILSNIHLCHRFLEKLPEEKIHALVKQVLPSESVFIISYASTLEKEKARNMLEGKAGMEFRILKWEFIFRVMLQAPLSQFNRRQFVHSVLQQLAGHYNLLVADLIIYFYKALKENRIELPSDIEVILFLLYEEMEKQSPEPLLTQNMETEWLCFQLEEFLITGTVEREETVSELYEFVCRMQSSNPDMLLNVIRRVDEGYAAVLHIHTSFATRLFATLLMLIIRHHGLNFPQLQVLTELLGNILAHRTNGDADRLRLLIYYCVSGQIAQFQSVLNTMLSPSGKTQRPDVTRSLPSAVFSRISEKKELIYLLQSSPKQLRDLWIKQSVHEQSVLSFLKGDKTLQYLWLKQMASDALREVAEEVFRLMELTKAGLHESQWLMLLVALTSRHYIYYSVAGLLLCLWGKLHQLITREQFENIIEIINKHARELPGLAKMVKKPESNVVVSTDDKIRTYIHNAGLVLLSPYFPRLFSMLNLMDESSRPKDSEAMIKGIFALQYLAYGERDFPEYELVLNKLLTGYEISKPLPLFSPLEKSEYQILLSLLKGVTQNWEKMKNTSPRGFQTSFLQRSGVLEELDDRWILTVESRAYDVLLDSLPWSYTPVKYLWTKKPIYVKWRE